MGTTERKNQGYIYVLEAKDIVLPICKIGKTTRTPQRRCEEINRNSSTGDLIWSVAYYIAVDDCDKFEELVHEKLSYSRHMGREIFNLNAAAANAEIVSILNSQTEIREVNIQRTPPTHTTTKSKVSANMKKSKNLSSLHDELLQQFASLLNFECTERNHFGQVGKPFGISDDNNGVQWNIFICNITGIVRIGVNLEGKTYNDWPISRFILSELQNPNFDKIKKLLNKPDSIYIRFARDAWQRASRPTIAENFIGDREYSFSECDNIQWTKILDEAYKCLDIKGGKHCRAHQNVTIKSKKGERVELMEVSPHLTVWAQVSTEGNIRDSLQKTINELQPVYEWVKNGSNKSLGS